MSESEVLCISTEDEEDRYIIDFYARLRNKGSIHIYGDNRDQVLHPGQSTDWEDVSLNEYNLISLTGEWFGDLIDVTVSSPLRTFSIK